jgi:membrane fusion protein, multidrug efflux system
MEMLPMPFALLFASLRFLLRKSLLRMQLRHRFGRQTSVIGNANLPMPKPASPFRRRPLVYVFIVLLVAAGAWYFSTPVKRAGRWGPNPPWAGTEAEPAMPVRVVVAEKQDLPVHLKAIGTVTALNTVTVRSRVDGQLLRVAFTEGEKVKKGQLLAEIDPDPYRIQLAQAEGEQRQNMAQLETARSDFERFQQLFEKKLVTTQQMDAQQSLVNERRGTEAADQARVDEARLQLNYTKIEAPIAGRLGLRRVDEGNLIRANDTEGLVTITQTQPIAVMFTVPEINLQDVVDPLRAGEQLPVEIWDRGASRILERGLLTTVDNQIDVATGTLRLKAEFPNEAERLFPNQFVNVRVRVRVLKDALVIPAAAVQFGSRGTYVYTVVDGNKSTIRDIVLGPSDGTNQAVTKGLSVGDQVVLEGLDRLREGRKVVVVKDGAIVPAVK